jgi:hypothetical protein
MQAFSITKKKLAFLCLTQSTKITNGKSRVFLSKFIIQADRGIYARFCFRTVNGESGARGRHKTSECDYSKKSTENLG